MPAWQSFATGALPSLHAVTVFCPALPFHPPACPALRCIGNSRNPLDPSLNCLMLRFSPRPLTPLPCTCRNPLEPWRPVAVLRASQGHVVHLRPPGTLPDALSATLYIAMAMPALSPFVPIYKVWPCSCRFGRPGKRGQLPILAEELQGARAVCSARATTRH